MPDERGTPPFLFVGERAWLDFVNTEMMEEGRRVDRLASYADLARWCAEAGLARADEAAEAARRWGSAAEGEEALARARGLRAALRAMAERLADGEDAGEEEAAALNAALASRPGSARLERAAEGWTVRFHAELRRPADLLAPVAASAAETLAGDDPARVKRCGNPGCILYFYDTTRNHARRWCSMAGCGNRMKVAAHYRRSRGGPDRPDSG